MGEVAITNFHLRYTRPHEASIIIPLEVYVSFNSELVSTRDY